MSALAIVRSPADRLAQLAHRANVAHKATVRNAILAGQALLEAKNLVGHGAWGQWVEDHCTFGERTAQQYMALARNPKRASDSIRQTLAAIRKPLEFRLQPPPLSPAGPEQMLLPGGPLYTVPLVSDWVAVLRTMPADHQQRSRESLVQLRDQIDAILGSGQ